MGVCKKCGVEFDDRIGVCLNCGSIAGEEEEEEVEQPSPPKRLFIKLMILLLIIGAGVFAVWTYKTNIALTTKVCNFFGIKNNQSWVCIPYERFGLITRDMNEQRIIETYGRENVTEPRLSKMDNEWRTVVFPRGKNQIVVVWKDNTCQVIQRIEHSKREDSDWVTVQGIKIGTPLEEVIQANGKDFEIFGFGWQYAGYVKSWQDGKLSNGLKLAFAPSGNADKELMGEKAILTDNVKLRSSSPKVIGIYVDLN